MKNVLLLDGDGTQTLPIARSLYKNGYRIHMFYTKKLTYGYPTRYVKYKKQLSLYALGEEKFVDQLKTYIRENSINVIIPLGDASASLLSKYKNELAPSANFIIPEYDIFDKGYSKGKLMKVCELNGFPHPRTVYLDSENTGNIDDSLFPAMLKPNYTTGGRGMSLVRNKDELNLIFKSTIETYGECHLQEFIENGGKQIKVQLFLNNNSELLYSSVIHKQRYYPENGGSSCCNITIQDDSLVNVCYEVLKAIGWIGFADFDLIEDPKDGVLKIMEINPRIPACIKSAVKSGIDYGTIIADASLGKELKNYTYTPGQQLRHIGFEVLWFFYSRNRFNTHPNWFKFFGRKLSYQDFSYKDPLPFLYGTFGNLKQQLSPEFRKSKQGLR